LVAAPAAVLTNLDRVRVALFVSCLVDQCWPSAGLATAAVLEAAGCEVAFDARQTCCGQPAFNSGYRDHARALARRCIEIFDGSGDPIVCPSGSCTAMLRAMPALFADEPAWRVRAERVGARAHELCGFLVRERQVDDLGASFRGRVTWHDACHGLRELHLRDEPRRLLRAVRGLELVEMERADACCGFGGTFAVKYPEISIAIADGKVEAIEQAAVEAVVSGDVSCLMHLGGRLSRLDSRVRTLHVAEVLAARQ
jgi:L-lactate dehydrogenase complex protein LldE